MRIFALAFYAAAGLIAISTSTYAQVCGDGIAGQVFATIGEIQDDGDARIVTATNVTSSTCSAFSGRIRYTGPSVLFSDCAVGNTFTAVGSLKMDGVRYALDADVIRCD